MGFFLNWNPVLEEEIFESNESLRASWWSCLRNFFTPFGSKQFNRTGIFRVVTRILVIISFRAQCWRNMFRAFNRAETLAAWERESWHTRRRMQTTYSRTHTSVLFVREEKRTNSYTRRGEEGLFFLAFSGPALEALNRFTCYDGLETWSNSIHNSYTCFWLRIHE